MLSGGLAAIAAMMLTARNGAAIPSMAGPSRPGLAAAGLSGPVLGGTLLIGGRVSVLGTFLGAMLVTMLTNGLLHLRVGEFWVQAALGVVLLAAVLLDLARRSLPRPRPSADERAALALASADWFGPLVIVVVAAARSAPAAVLSLPVQYRDPLLAIAANTVIALSQMIIIAIGQMNLAVGAIGGLAAISFAGMMQVWGLPPPLAGARR